MHHFGLLFLAMTLAPFSQIDAIEVSKCGNWNHEQTSAPRVDCNTGRQIRETFIGNPISTQEENAQGEEKHIEILKEAGATLVIEDGQAISIDLSTSFSYGPMGEPGDIQEVDFTPEVFQSLAKLSHLAHVNLRLVKLAEHPELLEVLPQMTQLQSLDLGLTGTTNAELGNLCCLKELKDLNLESCNITDEGLSQITELKALEVLNLRSTKITDDGLANLSQCSSLRHLNLKFTDVLGAGLEALANLPRLESLSIQADRNTAENNQLDLSSLQMLGELKQFFVGGNQLGNELVQAIGRMPKLEKLEFSTIGFLAIDDQGVNDIVQQFPSLIELDLNGATDLTDKGIAKLAQLEALEILDLGRTGITNLSAKKLAELPNLETLRVVGTSFGKLGINVMLKANPNLEILLHRRLNTSTR